MSWSIFTQGGGSGAAATWARELLQLDNVPVTPGNEQFIYDWQLSEGGGGKYNPLNQGPVPGHPELTTTGSQYGGGASDYASIASGLTGAVDYLNMPAYQGVQAALKANDPSAAEQALWASPWASSHYGYGTNWSTSPLPGQASAIVGTPTSPGSSGSGVVLTSSSSSGSGSTSYQVSGYIPPSNWFAGAMQAIDGFINPKLSANPSILGIFGFNQVESGIMTFVDRAAVAGLGLLVFGFGLYSLTKLTSGGSGTTVIDIAQRQQRLNISSQQADQDATNSQLREREVAHREAVLADRQQARTVRQGRSTKPRAGASATKAAEDMPKMAGAALLAF